MFHLTGDNIAWEFKKGTDDCEWLTKNHTAMTTDLPDGKSGSVIFTDIGPAPTFIEAKTDKSDSGEAVFTVNIILSVDNSTGFFPTNIQIALCKGGTESCSSRDQAKFKTFDIQGVSSEYLDLSSGTWSAFLVNETNTDDLIPLNVSFSQGKNGGIFSFAIVSNSADSTKSTFVAPDLIRQSPDSTLSVLWQIPQYFVISVGEILFSITGYELAYSQAPLSMKSLVFALYLLTDAVGNVIILIISSIMSVYAIGFDMSWVFLIYACLMFAIMILFVFIARGYKYTLYVREDEKDKATN